MLKLMEETGEPAFVDVFQRIRSATRTRTQGELAAILGIRQSSISEAKQRKKIPPNWYVKLFEKFGLSQDWLLTGIGPMNVRTASGCGPSESFSVNAVAQAIYAAGEAGAESALSAVYSMSAPLEAQGFSALDPIGKLALPSGLTRPNTLILQMRDNNMFPVIQRDAFFGVNTADVHLSSGGIFVLKHEYANMLVRRVFLDCDNNQYILRSDAAGHPENRMSTEEITGRVVGKVIWVIQEVL